MEAEFNYDVEDSTSTILEIEKIVKIRKLNKKIRDNLKLLYGYRCQICGQLIGEEFGSHIVEAITSIILYQALITMQVISLLCVQIIIA